MIGLPDLAAPDAIARAAVNVEPQRPNLMQRVWETIRRSGTSGATVDQIEAALPFDRGTIRNALKRLRLGAYLVLAERPVGERVYCVAVARCPVDRRGRPRRR